MKASPIKHPEKTASSMQRVSKEGASMAPPAYGLSFIDNAPLQKKDNKTGMPDTLKSGVESLSGIDMSDVKVHYNSSQPAQLNALAYAQGATIHIAPGQEKHLPHEAWHVVQQKQGRVRPTLQMRDKTNVNDDTTLEVEADRMGARALHTSALSPDTIEDKAVEQPIVQGVWGWLGTAANAVTNKLPSAIGSGVQAVGNGALGLASRGVDAVSNWYSGTAPGQYFGAAPPAAVLPGPGPAAGPVAAQDPSEIRKHYGAWYDAAKYVGSGILNTGGRATDAVEGHIVGDTPTRLGMIPEATKRGAASGVLGGGLGGLLLGGATAAVLGPLLGPLGATALAATALGSLVGGAAGAWQGGGHGNRSVGAIAGGGLPALAAGAVGATVGGLGSLAYSGIEGLKGATRQTGQAMAASDGVTKSVDDYFNQHRRAGAAYSLKRILGEVGVHVVSPLAKAVVPPLAGLLSGTANPTARADLGNHWKGAAPETLRTLTGKDIGNLDRTDALSTVGAIPHTVLAGGLQTAIGTGAGGIKGIHSMADKVSSVIAPGPIASLTLSTNLQSILKESPGSADATQSADTLGALAQVISAPGKILSGGYQWLTNRDKGVVPHTADQALSQREGANTFSDGISNLVRGGLFAGQELTKGVGTSDVPAGTIGKLINQNVVSLASPSAQHGLGYASPAVYGAHHLWRAASAFGQMANIEALPSYVRGKRRDGDLLKAPADPTRLPLPNAEETSQETIAAYAHGKSSEKAYRNLGGVAAATLGMIGTATGSTLLPVLAGLIGGGIGAYRLAKYFFSNDRAERTKAAKYLTEQLDNYLLVAPTPHNVEVDRIAKALERADVIDKFRGHNFGPASDEFEKMQNLLYTALESW